MPSIYCPDCLGSGYVIIAKYAIECPLCRFNEQGNDHLTFWDYILRPHLIGVAEQDEGYWVWLKETKGLIDQARIEGSETDLIDCKHAN